MFPEIIEGKITKLTFFYEVWGKFEEIILKLELSRLSGVEAGGKSTIHYRPFDSAQGT